MVAKKTAGQRTASGSSTDAVAGEAADKADGRAGPGAPEEKEPKGADARRDGKDRKERKPAAGKKAAAAEGTAAPARKRAAAKKSVAGQTSKKTAAAATGAAEAADETGAQTVVAKKSAGRASGSGEGTAVPSARTAEAAEPGELAVRPGEDPWTPDEVAEARAELTSEIMRLRSELEASGEALAGLMRDSGGGAGDDEADTGTKNITREHEMSLAAHAEEMVEQSERALARLDAGTYGLCEVCGQPIGKARMQAFPRATLCVEDKQKQERRG
ncbi:TraR/DksA family transcriptional regulator [Streptomyces sp. DT171]|uniref:TraR/DksA family transcriptional regulator n=1 Tax=Streptomyces sp. DT171 TaxID=3416524 RepID=UPI003CF84767